MHEGEGASLKSLDSGENFKHEKWMEKSAIRGGGGGSDTLWHMSLRISNFFGSPSLRCTRRDRHLDIETN